MEACFGIFTSGNRNECGEDLVNFALTQNFTFEITVSRKAVTESSNEETKNEIDYIMN